MIRLGNGPQAARNIAGAVGAVALMSLSTVPGSAQQDFCAVLMRVLADTPNKFLSFKTGRYHEKLKQWDANIFLPGMQGCRIDVEIDNYQCYNEGLSHRTADQQEKNLVSTVRRCLPGLSSTNRSKDEKGIVRSVVEWKTAEKRQVQVVKRHVKSRNNDDKIFVYVEAAD